MLLFILNKYKLLQYYCLPSPPYLGDRLDTAYMTPTYMAKYLSNAF